MKSGLFAKVIQPNRGTLTLCLPQTLTKTIEAAMASGDYRSPEEIALEALHLWARNRRWELKALADLHAEIGAVIAARAPDAAKAAELKARGRKLLRSTARQI